MTTFAAGSSREHLLNPFVLPDPSIRSVSRPASVFTTDSIDTIIASKPTQAQTGANTASSSQGQPQALSQQYRGFPSYEAYLDALRSWTESKMYFETDHQLRGFYGTKTAEYYMSKPGLRSHKKNKQIKETERRSTIARVPTHESDQGAKRAQDGEERKEGKLREKARSIFGRRASAV